MSTKLILIAHAGTRPMRVGGFPSPDVGLDDGGIAKADAYRLAVAPPERVFSGRDVAMAETAHRLHLEAVPDPALAEAAHGTWAGHTFEEVMATAPQAFSAWLADPAAGVPGGEGLEDVRRRVGGWMDDQTRTDGAVMGVTSATVIRAAIAYALDIPTAATLRIDIAPLSAAEFSFNRVWRLQRLAP